MQALAAATANDRDQRRKSIASSLVNVGEEDADRSVLAVDPTVACCSLCRRVTGVL